ECAELFQHPLLYSTFLLWMLTELYELLPEAGDLDKPKIAFFFDEAHLLFKDAPKALLEKVEQVVRLIRSKGVSVWFITQNPMDIPESVLAQIGNRVQHALRAYTPNEQKAIRAAARSFRVNDAFDTETVLQELATGEALVSVLDEKGIPGIVQRANILPPKSSMEAVAPAVIGTVLATSPLLNKYTEVLDRESAYEILTSKAEQAAREAEELARQKEEEKERLMAEKQRAAEEKARAAEERRLAAEEKRAAAAERAASRSTRSASSRSTTSTMMNKVASSAMNTIGREVGRQLIRGIFGTLKK
ncbi:MAG: DUF853 family protein, partial [Clostridia bacterium]|nr:DUF853 family protein [Clostridia bacterium]